MLFICYKFINKSVYILINLLIIKKKATCKSNRLCSNIYYGRNFDLSVIKKTWLEIIIYYYRKCNKNTNFLTNFHSFRIICDGQCEEANRFAKFKKGWKAKRLNEQKVEWLNCRIANSGLKIFEIYLLKSG